MLPDKSLHKELQIWFRTAIRRPNFDQKRSKKQEAHFAWLGYMDYFQATNALLLTKLRFLPKQHLKGFLNRYHLYCLLVLSVSLLVWSTVKIGLIFNVGRCLPEENSGLDKFTILSAFVLNLIRQNISRYRKLSCGKRGLAFWGFLLYGACFCSKNARGETNLNFITSKNKEC